MNAILILFFISLVSTQSWLTCPPSFNPTLARSGATTGPCDGDINSAPTTYIAAGDRLKVGWPSFNKGGGYVRLALVPAASASSQSAFDQNILKQTCYGYDFRPFRTAYGFCVHPCNARPGCAFQATTSDTDRYDTTIRIPLNLADGQYVLQWMATTGGTQTPFYSCSKLFVYGGNSQLSCPPKDIPNINCLRTTGPDVSVLMKGTTPGSFCYSSTDPNAGIDDNIQVPPVNVDCDPRGDCSKSGNPAICAKDLTGIVQVPYPRQSSCANIAQPCPTSKDPKQICSAFSKICTGYCSGKTLTKKTCTASASSQFGVDATCMCDQEDFSSSVVRAALIQSCAGGSNGKSTTTKKTTTKKLTSTKKVTTKKTTTKKLTTKKTSTKKAPTKTTTKKAVAPKKTTTVKKITTKKK